MSFFETIYIVYIIGAYIMFTITCFAFMSPHGKDEPLTASVIPIVLIAILWPITSVWIARKTIKTLKGENNEKL